MNNKKPHQTLRARRLVGTLALSLLSALAQAQLIDDVELRRVGDDALVSIRFVTPVQFQRSVNARSGDLGQVYYELLPTREALNLITAERRVTGGNGAPLLIVTDESAAGSSERSRKLVLRFFGETAFSARAGQGNRSIELLLRGKAALLERATPARAAAPAASAEPAAVPGLVLEELAPGAEARPIPALLQNYSVALRTRELDGRSISETVVSGFASRAEAEQMLQRLRARFPQARLDESAASAPSTASERVLPPPVAALGADAEARSTELLKQARALVEQGEHTAAIARLEEVLALPPHASSAEAQELVALARWRQGDPERARAEYELYLKLYPQGAGAARAREALLTLAPPAPETPAVGEEAGKPRVTTTLAGSLSSFYYGGQSKIRTQDFQDSPLSGLPELVSDATLSGTDQKQLISSVDINWRRRDEDSDLRLVLRDTYSADLLRSDKSKNKLSALYADYRLSKPGINLRVGRQSPTGGGVMGRFDGVQAGYRFLPKWRINAVAGQPSDKLLDTRRSFWGSSLESDDLGAGFSGSLYVIQQRIDGESDRRGIGSELRLLAGPVTAIGMLDYDPQLKGLNIGSLQATWQWEDNTIVNALFDRRSTPMLMLGNALFFQNPVLMVQARTLAELLQTQSLPLLRQQVHDTTAYSTQAMLSITRPVSAAWQLGADLRLTNVGALPPVADILPNGQPGTGNVWSTGLQLIGSNLYSARDTHVVLLTLLKGPSYRGTLLSYNNSSALAQAWLLEPSLRFYSQDDDNGTRSRRWAPGLRLSLRTTAKLVLESELSMEFSNTDGPNRHESSHRTFYYLGLRYDL